MKSPNNTMMELSKIMNEKKPMNPDVLKQAQKAMLHITKKVHCVCVKHDIKYWLDWGSLLGCVRHGGFIPWDDDMDICMQREDYEKFLLVAAEELGDDFFVQHSGSDSRFPYSYCKVRLNGTRWVSWDWKDAQLKSYGIWIDIFPMDYFPKSFFLIQFLCFCRFFFKTIYNWNSGIKSPHPIKKHIQHLLAVIFPNDFIFKCQQSLLKVLQYYKRSGVSAMFCMNTQRSVCQNEVFEKVVLKKFEDTEFFVPENYEKRLKSLYGDYMKLPPPKDRVNYHHIIEFDFGKYKSL